MGYSCSRDAMWPMLRQLTATTARPVSARVMPDITLGRSQLSSLVCLCFFSLVLCVFCIHKKGRLVPRSWSVTYEGHSSRGVTYQKYLRGPISEKSLVVGMVHIFAFLFHPVWCVYRIGVHEVGKIKMRLLCIFADKKGACSIAVFFFLFLCVISYAFNTIFLGCTSSYPSVQVKGSPKTCDLWYLAETRTDGSHCLSIYHNHGLRDGGGVL
ncbi:hypothetical protein QBC45DRAFT_152231 [Copromyces sp. CBS 386.78]|nr:hypothetical protein QBC45DRAFT_152231 [Copromyces sp. CBS 386.78]